MAPKASELKDSFHFTDIKKTKQTKNKPPEQQTLNDRGQEKYSVNTEMLFFMVE